MMDWWNFFETDQLGEMIANTTSIIGLDPTIWKIHIG